MTQLADVFNHLKTIGPITPIEALRDYGCFRLAAVIFDLRECGHEIDTEMVEANGKRFARYRLRKIRQAPAGIAVDLFEQKKAPD